MISESEVFDAVRRGYGELEAASGSEILEYFSSIEDDSVAGHVSHIKGILFEQEYVDILAAQGIEADVFEATNHPLTDIAIFDDGDIVNELQLKATDSVSYVTGVIEENPDLEIVVTSEIADGLDRNMVVDSGIEDAVLEEAVSDALFDDVVNPLSPFSLIRWFVGLPF